jgi:23S rRNA pseudouridine955/2504/2580 synthase
MVSSRKESVTYHEIDEGSDGQRLDNFLIRICKGVPKSHLYRVVRSGEVRVNGRRCAVDYRLQIEDRVRVPPLRLAERTEAADDAADATAIRRIEIPVLYEDERLLVVDKPAGLAVHGGSGVSSGLVEILRVQRPAQRFLELAHRLDKDTSGVLLLAKHRPTLRRLHELFRSGGLDKRYLVLVAGQWTRGVAHVRTALAQAHDENGEKRVYADPAGQAAYSIFRPLAITPDASLLEATIKTGRTHQIRVHLAHLGFPVLGDERYGDFALNRQLRPRGLRRMFLHARGLTLPYPDTQVRLELRSRLPGDLMAFLNKLDGMAGRLDEQSL